MKSNKKLAVSQIMAKQTPHHALKLLGVSMFGMGLAVAQVVSASVTDTSCNAGLEVLVSGASRSSTLSNGDCQGRSLSSTGGFSLTSPSATNGTTNDSSAMVSAGGELYESYVASMRDAAVLLSPNRALMMSRSLGGDAAGVDWDMGLAVQPVTGATNAWLTGTYTLLRMNQDIRVVDAANQTNAALSQVFDPVTMRISFDGNSGCTISSRSSWFSYSLTTDPAGAYSQPDGSDYGLHQAVYAGEGYAGSGGPHEDSVWTVNACDYTLGSDGKLLITYDYDDGDSNPQLIENAYYVSADLRYIVSTVDSSDLLRGFELGVRVSTIAGTQDERNDAVAGTYLFNAPNVELQGSTGNVADNLNQNSEQLSQCMSRGSLVLSTAASGITSGWNGCTYASTNTCSVLGGADQVPSVDISYATVEGSVTGSTCEFQVASDGSIDFSVNLVLAEGAQDVSFKGAVADNQETLVLRAKYDGSNMTNPSNSNAPERTIKNDLLIGAMVGIKYEGSLVADADSDGIDNLGEFVYSSYAASGNVKNDFDADGDSDLLWRDNSSGTNVVWTMQNAGKSGAVVLGTNPTSYTVEGVADFDADGDDDILFRDNATGLSLIWILQNGAKAGASVLGTNSSSYSVAGVADFDNDGDADILFRDTTGNSVVWRIQNAAKSGATVLGSNGSSNSVEGIADMDADGDADILFRNNSTGLSVVWTLQNAAKSGAVVLGSNPTSYSVVGVADFNGDGDADVLFRDTTGNSVVWSLENAAKSGATVLGSNGSSYTVEALADMDADGDSDILFRNNSSGLSVVWIMQNSAKSGASVLGTNATSFSVAGTADFDADGDEDILFRSTTGSNVVWTIENAAKSGASVLGTNATTMQAHFEKK